MLLVGRVYAVVMLMLMLIVVSVCSNDVDIQL